MAENLGLELEIKTSFESARASLDELRIALQNVRVGLQQMLQGNFISGLQNLKQAFTGVKDSLTGVKAGTDQVGAGLTEATAKTGVFARGLGALGPIGIAVGVAIVAALLAIKAAYEAVNAVVGKLLSLAKEVGTESQKAFDKFKAGVVAAGGTVTLLDRQLSQGLLKAMDRVKGASDRMFLELLRVAGPALLLLLQKIPALLNKIGEAAPVIGKVLTANFLLAAAAVQTLTDQISLLAQAQAGNFTDVLARLALGPLQFINNFKKAQKEIANIGGLGTGAFEEKGDKGGRAGSVKAAAEDLSVSELALNRLERQFADTKIAFDQAMAAIEENFRTGGLSAEEFFQQVVAEEELFVQRQRELIAEERKLINARPTLPRQKINELEQLAAKESAVLNEANDRIIAADRKANDALLKSAEDRSRTIDKESEALERSKEQWKKWADDTTQELIRVHNQTVDNVDAIERLREAQNRKAKEGLDNARAEIQREDPNSNINIFGVDPLGELTKLDALKEGGRAALASLSQSVGTFGGLMKNSLLAVAGAAQQVLATFILTGKVGGAAFKRLAADIIAQLIVMAAVKAIFELAEGFAAAAAGNAAAAALHFAAAKTYGIVAGVAAAAGAAIGAFGGLEGGGGSAAGAAFAGDTRRSSEIQINRGNITGLLGGERGDFGLLTGAIEKLNQKLDGVSPGDFLVRATKDRPDAVAAGVRRSLESDAGFIRTVGLAIERG